MKIAFAGTPEFAARALSALLAAGCELVLVLTQPDRPSGRGMQLESSPVKRLAEKHRIPLLQPKTLKDAGSCDALRAAAPDVLVVAAYGLILPQAILDIPPRGCINIHASMLPRWRGAAPIQRAIEAGDAETGITIMRMDAGLDTGPMLMSERLGIRQDDTAATLHDRLADVGARLIVAVLRDINHLPAVPQDEVGATYARKIDKDQGRVDWHLPAPILERRIRAFNPHPGAFTVFRGTVLKIWRADCQACGGEPGRVIAVTPQGVDVACGEGALRLRELQKAGGRRLGAEEFLRGFPVHPGDSFAPG